MTKDYIYQQTVVQWRTPILENGKLGNPEVVKKFTTEFKGSQGKHKVESKAKKQAEKKKEVQQEALSMLKTTVGDIKYD